MILHCSISVAKDRKIEEKAFNKLSYQFQCPSNISPEHFSDLGKSLSASRLPKILKDNHTPATRKGKGHRNIQRKADLLYEDGVGGTGPVLPSFWPDELAG